MIEVGAAPETLVAFALLLARIGGLMVFVPFWGSIAVSRQVRVALAFVLTFALFPVLEQHLPRVGMEPAALVTGVISEAFVGLALGLVGQLLLAALQLAGTLMGFQMGFSLVNVIDPQTQVEVSVISVLQNLIGITMLVVLNAHHFFLEAMVDSYDFVPALGARSTPELAQHIAQMAGGMFYAGFQLAAPVVLVGIIVDVLLGILGRAAPQIHILIAGLPLKVLVGFSMLMLGTRAALPFLERSFLQVRQDLYLVLRALGS